MNETITQAQVDMRARYYYLGCMAVLGVSFISNTLFSQLSQPVLTDPGLCTAYRLFDWLNIPYRFTHSVFWSAVADFLLFLLPVIASIIPGRRICAVLFSLLLLIYIVTVSTYSLPIGVGLTGLLLLGISFWFVPGRRFVFTWEAVRYYFFFVVIYAALCQIAGGAIFDPHYFPHILMADHAQYMYDYPGSFFSGFYTYLISHYQVSYLLMVAFVLIQAGFIGGFITRRYDRVYFALLCTFVVLDYLVMHIFPVELLVFGMVLLDWDRMEKKKAAAAS